MTNILVINSGSSSIKFQLISRPKEEVTASGLVERIGLEDAMLHYQSEKHQISEKRIIPDQQYRVTDDCKAF